ncbi:hypothetical protein VTO42DRAFT_1529 [Malbranchea cinnamomea]
MDADPEDPCTVPEGTLLRDAGGASVQGGRAHQEDRYRILLPRDFPRTTGDQHAFFAVYDGHGSDKVSEHASQHVHGLLMRRPEFGVGKYEEAIEAAIEEEDNLLLEGYRQGIDAYAYSGATVALCVVNLTAGIFVCANLGDSHVILADHNVRSNLPVEIRRLTVSHKPSVPSERSRIEEAGGTVNEATRTPRIGALNMSRTLGDLEYKDPINKSNDESIFRMRRRTTLAPPEERGDIVSRKPHFTRVPLQSGHRYVLALTSDGVTDVADDYTIMQQIVQGYTDGLHAKEISHKVASLSADGKRSDNATLVTAFFES